MILTSLVKVSWETASTKAWLVILLRKNSWWNWIFQNRLVHEAWFWAVRAPHYEAHNLSQPAALSLCSCLIKKVGFDFNKMLCTWCAAAALSQMPQCYRLTTSKWHDKLITHDSPASSSMVLSKLTSKKQMLVSNLKHMSFEAYVIILTWLHYIILCLM